LGKGLDRLYQGFLDHIFAVDHRAGHAGAVAMQLRPQVTEQPIQVRARFGRTSD
jgi:hypothetical protein